MQRHTRIVCALGAFLLVFGIGAGRLNAQATAAISGTITDTSGAAMADAQVQAKNTGTDITATTTSDSQGRFRFPDLLIGNYDLTAVKAGFQTVTRRGQHVLRQRTEIFDRWFASFRPGLLAGRPGHGELLE